MIRLNDYNFQKLSEGLSMAISYINENPLNAECLKKNQQLESGEICPHCESQSLLHELRDIHRQLLPYKKNTIWTKTYWSFLALIEALDKLNIKYEIEEVWNNEHSMLLHKIILITLSHYAMDSNGYAMGNEYVTFKAIATKRSESGLEGGIGYLVDNWVINPDSFDIWDKNLFDSEQLNEDCHKEDCKYKGTMDFDNCDCGEFVELYMSSDEDGDDFWYQELDHALTCIANELPEATFNCQLETGRVWSIGGTECYDMDRYTNDKDYRNGLQEDNGFEVKS
jgi:hypothetical protein